MRFQSDRARVMVATIQESLLLIPSGKFGVEGYGRFLVTEERLKNVKRKGRP